MPGGDRTGPTGQGPMTGRGAGFCGGAGMPGFMNRGWRGGVFGFFGRGRGGGRGWRNMFYATGLTALQRAAMGWAAAPSATDAPEQQNPEQELQVLKAQAEAAAASLDQIRRRIEEIATAKAQTPSAD